MLIALIPFTFWAVGDLIAVFVARRVGGFAASYASILLVVIGLSFLLPQHLNDFENYTTGLLLLNIAIGIIFLFGNQFYARAIEKSNASLTNVVAGTFPIVPVYRVLNWRAYKLDPWPRYTVCAGRCRYCDD